MLKAARQLGVLSFYSELCLNLFGDVYERACKYQWLAIGIALSNFAPTLNPNPIAALMTHSEFFFKCCVCAVQGI